MWRERVLRSTGAAIAVVAAVGAVVAGCVDPAPAEVLAPHAGWSAPFELPEPSVAEARLQDTLVARRSRRAFAPDPLPVGTVATLLWAGQGVTDAAGHRTAPSAGARYPIELYVVTADALWHYLPDGHRAEQRPLVDARVAIAAAAFGQDWIGAAPAVIVVAAVPARTEVEYGAVGRRLVEREVGHVAQNVLLAATGCGLAATVVGGFDPAAIRRLLALAPSHEVFALIPVGRPPTPR